MELMKQYKSDTVSVQRSQASNKLTVSLSPQKPVQAIYFGCHGNDNMIKDASSNLSDHEAAIIGDSSVYCDVNGTSLVRGASIVYANKARVGMSPYTYYQNVQPYFHSLGSGYSGIRDEGKLMYSFALDVNSFDHTGYVDLGKINDVSLEIELASQTGLLQNGPVNDTTVSNASTHPSKIEIVLEELTVGRFSGGAFGRPVL